MSEEKIKLNVISGDMNLELNMDDLAEVKESHDGIVFNLKNGLYLYATDTYMPNSTKQLIKLTIDKFKNVNIVVDLRNYTQPVKAQAK